MNFRLIIMAFAICAFSASSAIAQGCGCNDSACGCCDCSGNCLLSTIDGCCGVSPIVIDLGGKGFALTSAEKGVDSDFFGNGRKIRVAWTAASSQNAWLVLDRNQNGRIDDATEMFGNLTAQSSNTHRNGFLALAEFDKPENGGNGDGIIDARDQVFARLRLWVDNNHNGVSEPSELLKLSDVGILGISLQYTFSQIKDQFGNSFQYKGNIVTGRGADDGKVIYDVFLTTAHYTSNTTN